MENHSDEFQVFMKRALRALNKSKIQYVIIGGVAITIHGRLRTTSDLDIIIQGSTEQIRELEKCLKEEKFDVPQDEIQLAYQEQTHCSIFGVSSFYRLDIKGPTSHLDMQAFEKPITIVLLDEETYIEIPEIVIIAKLFYGSEQDWKDAFSILLRIGDKLDFEQLRKLAEQEKVSVELSKLLKEYEEYN
jgi:hypothetical protein